MAYSKRPALGQVTMANSEPVVIASDQSTLPVDTGLTQPLTDTELRATPVHVTAPAVADTGNSTTATLGNGGNFTGTAFDMNAYASWSVNVFADKASATNGFKIQWSDDGTNWDFTDQTTYVASVGNMVTFGRKARYVRVNYTNGTTPQGAFRVTAYAQPFAVRQTRKFVGNQLTDADTGQVVVAALQGHTTAGGGAWVDVKVNPSGALSVDATATDLDIRNLSSATDSVTIVPSGTQAVSGTFWQATQPVSGTVTANATLSAETTKVIGTVNVSTGQTITDVPATSGGLSKFHLVGAGTTNATNIKASAGQVYAITAFNIGATPIYIKFHNTAGTPTAGSGVTDTYLVPGNTAGAGVVINLDKGVAFSTGIAITTVTGITDANTTAIAADNLVLNIYYK